VIERRSKGFLEVKDGKIGSIIMLKN